MQKGNCPVKRILLALALAGSAFAAAPTNNFTRWEKDMAAFEQADRTNPPPKNAVLFIGSSGIRLWKTLAQDFPEHRVINRGFGGSHIADATHFAERIVFPYAPRLIVLRSGSNDLQANKKPEQVAADFKAFVEKVRGKFPDLKIVFVEMNPTIARWKNLAKEQTTNKLIADYIGQTPGLVFVSTSAQFLGPDGQPRAELLATDKLHFSPAGYKVLTALLKPVLVP
jgi:lysophospholipase L1-like esterase